ncbi:MAG: adenosylcobalamin-dependent ribonucleoside-diphosphate reductase [Pseudomonadota bacterium]
MNAFSAPIAEQIWDMKYRLKAPGGDPVDVDVAATWDRVAAALSAVELDPGQWQPRFRAALEGFRFLPAGRILAGAGTGREVTLFNCFVMGEIPDNLPAIFDHLREAAVTMQRGGGIGYDFSTLRPQGARVAGVGADASGPVSFMDVWDAMCRTIMSAGSRRGAMMAVLRCDHPDIEAFVAAKADPARLRNFNVSVAATDAFMTAVREDRNWDLVFEGQVYRTIRARALWAQIMRATYDYAEPGVIFIDRVNTANNLAYCETIAATNPCGEQPLPAYGACLLGSINLAALVRNPFSESAGIDAAELAQLVATSVRMMDNVVDASLFPLEAQAREAMAKRRIGLGVTGLADALAMAGLRYGSAEAVAQTGRWLRAIRDAAYDASADLAAEKGAFPLFEAEPFLAAEQPADLQETTRDKIAKHGIRNALLTSIAPTGTISLFAGNVSSGIEPIFALSYTRRVRLPNGSEASEEVQDHAVSVWRALHGDAPLPDHVITAEDLSPSDHIAMQAEAQRWVDSSISKTVNLSENISFEDFEAVYLDAYEQGCKGCTTYRPNAVTGSVLSVEPAERSTEEPGSGPVEPAEAVATLPERQTGLLSADPLDRPETLEGVTYKLKWPDSPHAMYVTMNDIVTEAGRQPFEIFINSKNMEHYAWTVALTRMISAVFRRGGDVSFVVEELKAVFDPRGGAWMKGRYVPSILAAIGGVIERHLVEIGYMEGRAGLIDARASEEAVAPLGTDHAHRPADGPAPASCPTCGSFNTQLRDGCEVCLDCGYSKCG